VLATELAAGPKPKHMCLNRGAFPQIPSLRYMIEPPDKVILIAAPRMGAPSALVNVPLGRRLNAEAAPTAPGSGAGRPLPPPLKGG